MSASPKLPPNYEPPRDLHGEPPRRRSWARIVAWVFGGFALLLLLLIVAGIFIVRSNRFHQYVINTAQTKLSASLGTQVKVQQYALHFTGISPTLDLYGVVINGAAPYPDPPILQVEHVRTGVRIVSAISRKWYMSDAEVHHPIVHVFVDKNGNTNIPKPKSSGQSNSNTSIFDIGVRHAVLDNGEVYYNNVKSVMSADLHDLTFNSGFDEGSKTYSGGMSYRNGHLKMENFNTINHDLDATFSLSPDRFTLSKATLRSGPSQFVLAATVDQYATAPRVQATYDAVVDAGDLRRIMKNATLPVGLIHANGTMRYESQPNVPALQAVVVNGSIASRALEVVTPSFSGTVRDIGAKYTLENGNALVRDIKANVLGGALTGTLTMRDIAGNSRSHLQAALRGLSLEAAKASLSSTALAKTVFGGSVNADADATWGKTFNDLSATANADLNGNVSPANGNPAQASRGPVPVTGIIHAKYSAPAKQITLTNSYVRLPQTSLNLNGTVSDRSALQVRLQASDLHELETIADMFSTPKADGTTAQPLGLYGAATFNGTVRGTTSAPRIAGQLNATDLQVRGSKWRAMRANIDAAPNSVSIQNGELIPADRGRIAFALTSALRNWSFTPNSQFQVNLNASQLNVASLAKLTGSQAPVSGTLDTNVQVHGTESNPIGQGTLNLVKAKVAGEDVQAVNVRFNGTGDNVHATLFAKIPAGTANGDVVFNPKTKAYDARVQTSGIRLEQVNAVKSRNMGIAGVLTLLAQGKGTLDDPQLTATLQIPQLRVKDQTISSLNLQTNIANHVANIALNTNVLESQITGKGTVNLTGDYQANLALDSQRIQLQPIVAAFAPTQAGALTGATELHATVRGPLKRKELVEAHLTIPTLAVNYKNAIQLGAPSPIRVDYTAGVLNIQRSSLTGTGTNLQFQGRVPVVDAAAPISVLLLGTVDLRLAQLVSPDMTSSGQLQFDINSFGQRSDPNVQGQVRIVNANLAMADAPVGLQNGNGVLTLTKDRLNVTSFEGTVGGGTVNARGGVLYRPAVQFDLAMAARGVRILIPAGVRTGVDANLTMTGTTEKSTLAGTVNVEQLSFTPDFDLTEMMGSFGGTTSVPPAQGFTNNLQLQLAVRTTSGIDLVSRQLSLQGNANLNVRGTAAQPVLVGRVNLLGGDLLFSGNRYTLQGGTIDFVNPTRTEPNINVAINTTIQQYNIAMRLEGPVDRLRTSYTSDPALPPADIINLVAFGKTSEAAAANPSPPGSLSAQSAIASAVSGQVTSRVEKIAGISHLSIDPTLGGNNQSPGATITVQQRVTSKIFVTFSTDVTATSRQVIQLEYQPSRRVSISGTRDQNGGFAFDTRFKKDW